MSGDIEQKFLNQSSISKQYYGFNYMYKCTKFAMAQI